MAPEQQQQEMISGAVDFHEIVRLDLPSSPEVQELWRLLHEVWYIVVIHAKEAKYMLKRPVVRKETRLCLTKDDMDLW
jgi:hypothetical protein